MIEKSTFGSLKASSVEHLLRENGYLCKDYSTLLIQKSIHRSKKINIIVKLLQRALVRI